MTRKAGKKVKVPPDGGWGWVVVFGSSLINLSTRAIEPSFGLLFGDLLRDLGQHTTGASVVVSTLDAIINFSGIFVGPLIKQFTYRKVAIVGGLLSSTALFLTAFADSMSHLIVSFSVLGGLGFGLAASCTLVGINSYFSKKKGQAVGLSMAGTALGFMAMPQIISFLLSVYDFRSAMLILAAFSLHSIAGAFLFQPVEWHMKTILPVEEQLLKAEEAQAKLLPLDRKFSLHSVKPIDSNRLSRQMSGPTLNSNALGLGLTRGEEVLPAYASAPALVKRKTSVISNVSLIDFSGSSIHICLDKNIAEEDEDEDDDDTGLEIKITPSETLSMKEYRNDADRLKLGNNNQEVIKRTKEELTMVKKKKLDGKEISCWGKICKLFDLNLLKDFVYLNILYGLSISMVAEMNFKLIIPFFFGSLGYDKRQIALSLSAMAVADIIARITIPPILDRITLPKRVTLMIGSVLVSLCRSLLAEQTETIPLMICLVVHGFFRGMTLINNPLVLSEYATGENFPAVLGLSMVAKGVFIVVLGPLCGWIRDTTRSYPIYIHFQSVMIFSMVIAWTVEFTYTHYRTKAADKHKATDL